MPASNYSDSATGPGGPPPGRRAGSFAEEPPETAAAVVRGCLIRRLEDLWAAQEAEVRRRWGLSADEADDLFAWLCEGLFPEDYRANPRVAEELGRARAARAAAAGAEGDRCEAAARKVAAAERYLAAVVLFGRAEAWKRVRAAVRQGGLVPGPGLLDRVGRRRLAAYAKALAGG